MCDPVQTTLLKMPPHLAAHAHQPITWKYLPPRGTKPIYIMHLVRFHLCSRVERGTLREKSGDSKRI